MSGSKNIVRSIINQLKIKQDSNPTYTVYLLEKLFSVLEDVWSVGTAAEIQEAIDSIGTGSGTIFIESGTIDITTPIDIDNCGSIVIYGHGDNTILKPAAGVSVFNITCCTSCLIRTLKIDTSNYLIGDINRAVVDVNEASDNVVTFEDVTIDGISNWGIGINLQSNNCMVEHCNLSDLNYAIMINNSNSQIITTNTISSCDIGIYLFGTLNTITGNISQSNVYYGIYGTTSTYNNISINTFNSNSSGIYFNSCNNNTISSNIINSNINWGMYLTSCSYNTISGNTVENNDSNDVGNRAGIGLYVNSDYNSIVSNSVNNNNNAGAGICYGIYIAAATCNENLVDKNNANGNDIDYMDSGSDTTISYYVQDYQELQDAIDSIGSKAGRIIIDNSFTVSTTIDIDGNGSYIIEGEGSNSTLTLSGDFNCFNITSARFVLLQNFKINGNALVVQAAISINEASDNLIEVDNIEIVGASTGGSGGITPISDNCRITNCIIDGVDVGIMTGGQYHIIQGNTIKNCTYYGILFYGANNCSVIDNVLSGGTYFGIYVGGDYNKISGNVCGGYADAIYIDTADYNDINNNTCNGNDSNDASTHAGIYVHKSDYNKITENSIINNNNAGAGTCYGVYISSNISNNNIIRDNFYSGNDVKWLDNGTDTEIEYICSTAQDIQDAIDSIAAKTGTINITATSIVLSARIDIDGAGKYIIKGQGTGTLLSMSGDFNCFRITSAQHTVIRDMKINGTGLGFTSIIGCHEPSEHTIIVDNCELYANDDAFVGVDGVSDNIIVENCYIHNVLIGANISKTSIVRNCIIDSCYGGISLSDNNGHAYDNKITNSQYGVLADGSDYLSIHDNHCEGNSINGILLSTVNHSSVTSNTCVGNDSNDAGNTGGIYLKSNSDYNKITNNTSIDNNNAGAGNGYGICIESGCDENIVRDNYYGDGNDVKWLDSGTNNQIEYICTTAQDIQDAIDSIATKSGVIKLLVGTYTLSATIDVDGGGFYRIEGQGAGTIIDCNADRTAIKITSAKEGTTLTRFSVDATDLTTSTKPIIELNEASDNKLICENIIVTGDGSHGFGIAVYSNNCLIYDNILDSNHQGVYIYQASYCDIRGNLCKNNAYAGIDTYNSTDLSIVKNICYGNTSYGIRLGTVYNSTIVSNTCNSNDSNGIGGTLIYNCTITGNTCNNNNLRGIYATGISDSTITGNTCNNSDYASAVNNHGIYIKTSSDRNTITGNTCNSNNNTGAGVGYGIYIDSGCDYNVVKSNSFKNNDVDVYIGANTTIGLFKKLPFEVWEAENEVNCTVTQVYDSTEKKIVMYVQATGAGASVDIYAQFIIPENFYSFRNVSDDLIVKAIQSAGADIDATITLNFYDASGTDSDDDSVIATALTGSWASYDCAIDAGSFINGHKVIVKITLSLPDADDEVMIGIPIINYY